MDWYLDKFRYRTCIWCNNKWYILNVGGRDGRFFSYLSYPPFLNDKERADPARLVFRFGNKGCAIVRFWEQAAPLLGSGNRGRAPVYYLFLIEMSQLHFPF
jgi:hypothetical protein